MPGGSGHLLVSLVILVLCSGFFSATETAYSCVSKIKLKTLSVGGNRRAGKVLEFAETKYDRLLSTILIGNNIVNISASAIATIFFAKLLSGTHIDSTFVATAVMTVAVLIFGEITPKYIAKAYPERLSMLFYPAIKAVYLILIPLNFVFIGWKNLISKIFSLDREEVITLEDILEELVGDIWDEYDEAQADFKTCADGSLVFSGDIPLEKMLGAIGADAEKITCESNTLSGWIVELAGEVLEKGKSLERDGFCFEILETNGKVHSKVKVRRAE